MILDFSCDFNECNSPVEFVKGQTYQSTNGPITIYFLRCLNLHYYIKYKDEVELLVEPQEPKEININFIQIELPFEDEL